MHISFAYFNGVHANSQARSRGKHPGGTSIIKLYIWCYKPNIRVNQYIMCVCVSLCVIVCAFVCDHVLLISSQYGPAGCAQESLLEAKDTDNSLLLHLP